jgi:hypothetical protein
MRKNKERRGANRSLFIMVVGILAAVLPVIMKADMLKWGFASVFVGGIVAITSFFVFLMFNRRAGVYERMFSGENLLAYWRYSKDFWQKENKEDLEETGMAKIAGFFLGGIFALIGIVIFFIDTEENGLFLLIMLGVGAFIIIIGLIASAAESKRLISAQPEAIIACEGLFYKNILYTWNSRAVSYLESVSKHPTEPNEILFVLRQLRSGNVSITHFHRHFISIPVPPGQEQSADDIIQYFKLPISEELQECVKKDR